MKTEDEEKTREQLTDELAELRKKVAELQVFKFEQDRVLAALRESEKNFRTLTENAADGILIGVGEGATVYANRRIAELTGYSVAELLRTSIKDLAHPDEFEKIIERYRKTLEGKSVPKQYETTVVRKDGKSMPIELAAAKTIWQGQPADLVFLRDITERKRAEDRLTKLNKCLVSFASDPTENINRLVTLCGEQLRGTCALYNRLENGLLHSVGQWNTPQDFISVNKPDGHICFDLIQSDSREVCVIRGLQQTIYAQTDPNVTCYNLKTYIGKGVSFGGTFIGSLCVVYQEDYVPSEDDKNFLGIVASAIGVEERRRHAEEVLRFSRFSVDHAVNTIVWVDHDARFIDINDAFCRSVGYSREELLSMTVHDIDPEYSAEIWPEFCEKLKQSGSLTFESCHRTKEGKTFPVEITANYLEYNGKEYHCSFVRDITERKHAEEEMARVAREWQITFDASYDAIWVLDQDQRVLRSNKTAERFFQRPRNELIGKHCCEIVHGTSQPIPECPLLRARNSLRRESKELQIDKGWFEVTVDPILDAAGQFAGAVHIVSDITERKWAEETLQASKELFEKIFVSQLDAIFLLDAINPPTILDSNPAATEVFGYTREEMVGRTMDFLHVDETTLREFQEHLRSTIAERGLMHLFEFRMRRKDGKVFPTEHSAIPLEDEQGKRIGWVSVVRDITEAKRAKEELMERELFNFALFEYNPIQNIVVDLEGKVTGFNLAKKKSGDRLPNIGDTMYKDYAGKHENDMHGELMKCIQSGEIKEFPEEKYGDRVLSITMSPFPKGAVIISQDITKRKQSEERILTYQEQLHSLASELSLIEERERHSIATELHDNISQTLAITKIKLGMAQEVTSSTDWFGSMNEIGELIDQAIQYTRSLTFELSPPILYELGLEAGIEWLTEQIQEKHGIQIGFEDDRQSKSMSEEIRITLFKATRELLINIVKHAEASKATVSIWREDNSIRIRVEDDGVGFSTSEGKALGKTTGFGLFNIGERIRYFEGDMVIESEPGRGTRVTLSAPLEGKED